MAKINPLHQPLAQTLRRVLVTASLIFPLYSCDSDSKETANSRSGTTGADNVSAESVSAQSSSDSTFALGLPSSCEFDTANSCLICTPRVLPLRSCSENLSDPFDPALDCSHEPAGTASLAEPDSADSDLKVRCGDAIKIDLSKVTDVEKLFNDLPLIVAGAKLLLGKFLADDSKMPLIQSALDLLTKHKMLIFAGGDMAPLATDIVEMARNAGADIDDAKAAETAEKVTSALNAISEKRTSGAISDNDIMVLGMSFVAQMPGAEAILGSGLTLDDLLGALRGESNPAAIIAILQATQ